jgi:ATP-dependent Clp protease ATP-binding subunit ClpA
MLDHDYIGTEHLLLGLLGEEEGAAFVALASLRVGLADARRLVEEIVGRGISAPTGRIPFTPRAKKVLELSLREAIQMGQPMIGTEHILLGMTRQGDGVGNQVLSALGADPDRMRAGVLEVLSASPAGDIGAPPDPIDPRALLLGAADRARRARDVSARLAGLIGDPSVTAEDLLLGLSIKEDALRSLEVAAARLERERRRRDEPDATGDEGPAGGS